MYRTKNTLDANFHDLVASPSEDINSSSIDNLLTPGAIVTSQKGCVERKENPPTKIKTAYVPGPNYKVTFPHHYPFKSYSMFILRCYRVFI